MILETIDLVKYYGKIKAVNKLNLSIPEHSVFGILGPNGSGKTTTLGMVLDVIEKSSGSFHWNIGDPGHERRKIGAILESPNFYPYLSGYENLRVVGTIKEIRKEKIDAVLEEVGLYDRKNDRFKTYSLGMKQRLAIASALLADPEVLILDEPTNGLDPKGIVEIRELIIAIAAEGRTVILASHLLDEVQKVCTDFCVLSKGSLIYTGKVDELTRQKNRFSISAPDPEKLVKALDESSLINAVTLKDNKIEIFIQEEISPDRISKELAEKEIFISSLTPITQSLEKRFIEILAQNESQNIN